MKALDHKAIGLRIRKQRMFIKMSREELAQKIGVSTTFLTDIELGTKGFSVKSLNRFVQVLKISADTVLYGSEHTDESANLLQILAQCSEGTINYAEDILLTFLSSHESPK